MAPRCQASTPVRLGRQEAGPLVPPARWSYAWPVKPVRRYLDRLVAELFAPLTRHSGKGWRVLGTDSEQGLQIFVEHRGRVLLLEFADRNEELDCSARTARFNVSARCQFDAGAELDDADRRLVAAIVETVRRREHILPDPPRSSTGRSMALRADFQFSIG